MFVVLFKIGNPESLKIIYKCMLPLFRGETIFKPFFSFFI